VQAKADAEIIAVRPALQHPNVSLQVNTEVTRLQTDAAGRTITGVVAQRDGKEETLTADIVVLSAGATNSARVLLASTSDAHPNGLANGSDQVGRNYMFHNSKAVVALAKERNDTSFQKTLGLNDLADSTSQRNESCEMSESRSWEDVCKDIMATSALNRRSWPSGSERRVGDLSTSPRRSAARAPWSGSWCAMAGTSKLTHSAGSRDRVA
jgi:choline dehydrogenase-like flavoprotein